MTIQSFKCADTQRLHQRSRVARFANIEAVARRKLGQLDAVTNYAIWQRPLGIGWKR